jgi:hypothetical protein
MKYQMCLISIKITQIILESLEVNTNKLLLMLLKMLILWHVNYFDYLYFILVSGIEFKTLLLDKNYSLLLNENEK